MISFGIGDFLLEGTYSIFLLNKDTGNVLSKQGVCDSEPKTLKTSWI